MNKQEKLKKTDNEIFNNQNDDNKNFTNLSEEAEKNRETVYSHKGKILPEKNKNLPNERLESKKEKSDLKFVKEEKFFKNKNDSINKSEEKTKINQTSKIDLNLNKTSIESNSNSSRKENLKETLNMNNHHENMDNHHENMNNINKGHINNTKIINKVNSVVHDNNLLFNSKDDLNQTKSVIYTKEEENSTEFNSTKSIDNFMLSTKTAMNITTDDEFFHNENGQNKADNITSSSTKVTVSNAMLPTVQLSDPSHNRTESNKKQNTLPDNIVSSNSITNIDKDINKGSNYIQQNKSISKINHTQTIDNTDTTTTTHKEKSDKIKVEFNHTNSENPVKSVKNQINKNNTIIIETKSEGNVSSHPVKADSDQMILPKLSDTAMKRQDSELIDQEKKIQATLDKKNNYHSSRHSKTSQKTSNNTKNISAYENLRKRKEEFEEIEKTNERQEKKPNRYKESDSVEYRVYKRIIEISVSLIVIGLFMGILLGIIIVTYFNSKK